MIASVKDQFGNMQYLVAAYVVNVGEQYSSQVNFIQTALYNGSGAKIGDVSGLAPWANGGAVAVGPGKMSTSRRVAARWARPSVPVVLTM